MTGSLKALAAAAVSLAALMAGCGGGAQEENASNQRLVAETDYPVAHYDLSATLKAGQSDADVRKLAAAIADLDGVAVSEADYGGRVIRVALEAGTTPSQVSDRLASLPGVTAVKSSG